MSTLPTLLIFLGILAIGTASFWLLWRRQKEAQEEGSAPFLLIQQQLDHLRSDFLKVLEQNRQGMDHRLDNAAKVFSGLESRMAKVEEVSKQVLEVGKDIAGLQQILKAPKLRGNFGEELLGDLLGQMMPQENYELQYSYKNGERVDAVIKTAQGLVPIDAKFPLENFSRLMAADNENEKRNLKRLFIQDVRKHVTDIASKYIRPSEGTFEFALMYIPAENVYYEIVTKDFDAGENVSIASIALKKRVIPISPNTFYAYLQTILLGLRGMQVEKKVREIVVELARLRKGLENFRDDFSKIGTHLGNAQGSYEKADKRLTRLEEKFHSLEEVPENANLPSEEKPALPSVREKSLGDSSLLEQ